MTRNFCGNSAQKMKFSMKDFFINFYQITVTNVGLPDSGGSRFPIEVFCEWKNFTFKTYPEFFLGYC